MNLRHATSRSWNTRPLILSALAFTGLATHGRAQFVFSIDYRGPTIGTPATGGGCITEADLLIAGGGPPGFGPMPAPAIAISGAFGPPAPGLGLAVAGACACHPPAVACGREVDALSFGNDGKIRPGQMPAGTYVFSVDECSPGIAGSPLAPNVTSETPVGDAAADVFEALNVPGAPVAPGPIAGNSGIIDGNGFASGSGGLYPGVGLVEPTFPGVAVSGDDIDAIDLNMYVFGAPIYFSLDAAFMNPCLGLPNTGSAAAYGFLPGAVLVTPAPGGPPAVYAAPAVLGLDLFGPATDDLDALAICENAVPGFQVAPGPFTWLAVGGTDMLLFSVRRGSAVIGMPDSVFGLPIQPGDILIPPVAGGLSPFPGIFVAAEALGLVTARGPGPVAVMPADLDALSTRQMVQTALPYCFGSTALCPCGNVGAPGNGCANSVFAVGGNLSATGVASVSADTVVLTGTNMPPSSALYFQGTAQAAVVFGDGIRCAAGAVLRLGTKINTAAGTSSYPVGADLPVSVRGAIPAAGGTRFYQCWYRNAAAFCTPSTFNLTNGLGLVWTP